LNTIAGVDDPSGCGFERLKDFEVASLRVLRPLAITRVEVRKQVFDRGDIRLRRFLVIAVRVGLTE
jgi:hypothetical protein